LFQPHLKYTLTFCNTFLASELSIEKKIKYSRQAANSQSMGFAINISHAHVPVLVKGLYQTESYSLHAMQLIRILSTEEYFYFVCMIDRHYSSYCFLASELLIEKKNIYSRQAANSQSMGFVINISHAQ
jgi:hypothetical protein